MIEPITTRDVCAELELSEPRLRHLLRRPGVPRPRLHPTARVFLWTQADLERLRRFLEASRARAGHRCAMAEDRPRGEVPDAR